MVLKLTNMKLFQAYNFLILLSLTARAKYAKPGCNDTCGKVTIPYPFGIGASCSVNKWYAVDCNASTPYLSALNHVEVVAVDLENQTIIVNTPTRTKSVDLGTRSPFLFSKSHNKLVFEGCGNAVMMDHGSVLAGCSTTCYNDSVSDKNTCVGISCCQTTIPHFLKSYTMNLTGRGKDGGCGSAFLVDKYSYVEGCQSFVPVSLLWTLSDIDMEQITCCSPQFSSPSSLQVDLGNGTSLNTWKCRSYQPFVGNAYMLNGCNAMEECERCERSAGFCNYTSIYDIDGVTKELSFACDSIETKYMLFFLFLGLLILVGGLIGFTVIVCAFYKVIKKTLTQRRRKIVFKRINGALLLKQQEEVDRSLVDKTILFTSRELEKATNNFNENRILGRGGQGTVYKGMLADGRIVAVKKSKIADESQIEQFINEVVILSQVNHRNVVKLLGCCLETEVPLLVSEFISNGTLYDRIHNETNDFPMSFNMRLQIAAEVAGALAYLHSATSFPVYHRDIKTANVLLDDKYRAKVSDFGTSRFVSMDQTHLTTLVKGTFGYLDPEYFQSSQLTEKSDVYSFGVLLIEILTGEKPVSLVRFGENRSLATHFMLAMEEGRVMSVFDPIVITEGSKDELSRLANLATRCLNLIGKNRPAMKEVAIELETIRTSRIPSVVQTNISEVIYGEELLMLTSGESTSTFMTVNDKFSQ